MGMLDDIRSLARAAGAKARALWPGESSGFERGSRATPEASMDYLYRLLWVDPNQRQAILDIRDMDRRDGRVKRIHGRVARDVVKGGLVFSQIEPSDTLRREWADFERRLQLNRPEKLRSDARGMVMEGAACLQWVLDAGGNVVAGVRMPSETIIPQVTPGGQFKDPRRAYVQFDPVQGRELAAFALYQLTMARFDPDSFDDAGALGRPFLDSSREVWKKLRMTEEDLVIRRRQRAPLRMAHVLEGADGPAIDKYRAEVERDQGEITTDYYLNRKGSVTAVQGDANLDQIGDVVHLLDGFFAGAGVPKGLMGYTDDMARDILEDLKRDYYEEVDSLQDTLAFAYDQGFRLHLLLKGINPDAEEYWVGFAERRTETPNQTTDRALKYAALGMPRGLIYEEMGYNPQDIRARLDQEAKDSSPYPDPAAIGGNGQGGQGSPTVKVTPGNAPKGESATSTTHSNRLSEHWPGPPPADPAHDAIKALGEIGLALAERPDPAPAAPAAAAPQPITLHFHEAAVPPAPTSAQPVTLTAQFTLPEAFGTAPAPVVKNEIIVQPAAVIVPPAVVKNEINLPEMSPSFEATINPELVVKLPPRRTETTVNRDKQSGEMTGSTSIERDAE